jgi:hypothetical protein
MFLVSRERPVRRAHNLAGICLPTVYTMWNPHHLTTLYFSTACEGETFTSLYVDDVRTSQETHI